MAHKYPHDADGRPAVVRSHDPVAEKAAAIKVQRARPPTWKTAVKRALVVAVVGAAIYRCCRASLPCWVRGRACPR